MNTEANENNDWEAVPIPAVYPIPARVGHTILQVPMTPAGLDNNKSQLYMLGGSNEKETLPEVWELVAELHHRPNNPISTDPNYETTAKMIIKPHAAATQLHDLKFPGIYEFAAVAVPPVPLHQDSITSADLSESSIWIFGGGSQDEEAITNAVHLFHPWKDPKEITKVEVRSAASSTLPSARTQGGNKCVVELNGVHHLVIFSGGGKNNTVVDGSLYIFNTKTETWSKIDTVGDSPPSRQGHVMVSIGTKVYVHGGLVESVLFDDMHMIDLAVQPPRWIPIDFTVAQAIPLARAAHNGAVIGHCFYIFGGLGPSGEALGDLWRFDSTTNEWTEIHYTGTSIKPRVDFAMTSVKLYVNDTSSSSSEEVLLIHGGLSPPDVFYDDMFMLHPHQHQNPTRNEEPAPAAETTTNETLDEPSVDNN